MRRLGQSFFALASESARVLQGIASLSLRARGLGLSKGRAGSGFETIFVRGFEGDITGNIMGNIRGIFRIKIP